ncbi:MAG TPA: undecaprenyl-phosphate galactose phosphotransferase WbaP [Bryobacteraceae bacterium]|nr:undecaprenyl-phosphate galactose phosphotransferase WbaP [Bryobacteraceae bacterium]
MASSVPARTRIEQMAQAGSPALLMGITLMIADLITLSLAVTCGFWVWSHINPSIPPLQSTMFLAVGLSIGALAFNGMYPGIGITAVEVIRRLCYSITLVYLVLTASMLLVKEWWINSRGGFLLAWALSLLLVPLGRWLVSNLLRSCDWWGVPVIILGAGKTASTVIRNLRANRVLGYRPVACLDDDPHKQGECLGVPVSGPLYEAEYLAGELQIRHAIVAMPGMSRDLLVKNLHHWSTVFPNILIVPDLFGVASLWIAPRDLGGVLGLEIRHNLLNPMNRWVKRAMDLTISSFILLFAAPFLALAAFWTLAVSPGDPFYVQEREGKHGALIRILKLRTMYPNAEGMLDEHLAGDPEALREWNQFCKLKKDPRVLPGIGTFLRTSSLDELPQLWNILKGDMSLVGPRPFPVYHNERFDAEFRKLRTEVKPGLTGLWQVSARSDGDLEVQASLDTYYIRNWSLWLDLYILIRTAITVLGRNGAY